MYIVYDLEYHQMHIVCDLEYPNSSTVKYNVYVV